MESRPAHLAPSRSQAVYRWSFFIAALTFPLIWLGGLVTTHDAGMAVPDWPGTFGYNLFLYPWTTWLFGPFDLLVEHGHRLLAALVGFLAIVLVFVSRKVEQRPWAHRLSWLFLLAVISQGLLGGVRVLLDQRIVALIHGCVGPLVFALACLIVMVNAKDWSDATLAGKKEPPDFAPIGSGLRWGARILFPLTIGQLILGAHLRHALPTWKPALFVSFVHTHLLFATLITFLILVALVAVYLPRYRKQRALRTPVRWLSFLLILQVALGLGTWVTNYALPWPEWNAFFANYTIAGRGFWETMIINGHQATGSLLIVCSLWLLCRVERRAATSRFEVVPSRSSYPSILAVERRGAELSS
ncbi:Heme A synthase [Pirellula sp. SH-Sr6A]|uniref:COX15/CtaA family protein n=1 Tax=Pirellula sp. SH-Sr6A TaxID=1632865 RepID=UPI00078B39F3|nr:COX15/CtaA family protein [Pirellula sp. SH-Sr6A]AMV32866.1 Heme A synthase [Pirellula sp. SH-Sr6A]